MPTNALLGRWSGGWVEAVDAAAVAAQGRREAFVSVGAAQTAAEATAILVAQLADLAKVREGVTVETDPVDAAYPYLTYLVGDTIDVADEALALQPTRVNAISMTEDDDGEVTWAPEAGDLLLGEAEAFNAALKKMANGTLSGRVAASTPKSR